MAETRAGNEGSTDSAVLSLPELEDRRTTSDQIADALREAILTGEFRDGEELNQVALAKHFKISRVPIREALRQLQAEGLVVAKAHQRTVVSSLTLERVDEILEIRTVLEAMLLQRSINQFSPEDIARLVGFCTEMDEIEDHSTWLRKNREFHHALYEPSRASFTVSLLDQLATRVERYLHLWSGGGMERNKEANAEHWRIVKAIQEQDASAGVCELASHIERTRARVAELWDDSAFRAETSAPS